jgi:type II secretory pathway component PulF
MQNYRVTYLMPRPENLMAQPDKDVPGFYRHATLLAAPNPGSIISEIRQRGGLPLDIKAVKPKPAWMNNVNRAYKLQMLQAINYNVRGGMSAARALEMVVEGETGTNRGMLNPALTVLRTGGTFPEAMRSLGFFDSSTLSIIEAGERTGRMKDSLNAAAGHYEKSSNALKAMFGAVSWTLLDIGFAVSSIIGLRFSLLPTLADTAKTTGETEAEREAFKALVDQAYLVNDVLIGGTLVLLAFVFLGIYGYAANVRSIRDRAEAVMARVPSLGSALLNTGISTSFTVAASMMKGADHLEVRDFWATAVNRVETGETIPRSLSSPLLNSSEAMLIASHTTQRELGEVLERIAERRDGIALAASKSFALWMFVASMMYSGIAVMFTLYVVYVQNKQMMSRVQG